MAEYETMGEGEVMGEEGYQTVGLVVAPGRPMQQARPMAPAAQRPGMMPFRLPPGSAFRPMAQPAASSESRVRQIVAEMLAAAMPYASVPPRVNQDEAMFPMGLGFITLTAANPTDVISILPQRAFRGERVVFVAGLSSGVTGDVIPLVTAFNIGDYKQLVGNGAVPLGLWAPDAFGVRLMLDGAVPGVQYDFAFSTTSAVPGGESVVIAGAVVGRAGEAANR
jgi:hypothetical protein